MEVYHAVAVPDEIRHALSAAVDISLEAVDDEVSDFSAGIVLAFLAMASKSAFDEEPIREWILIAIEELDAEGSGRDKVDLLDSRFHSLEI